MDVIDWYDVDFEYGDVWFDGFIEIIQLFGKCFNAYDDLRLVSSEPSCSYEFSRCYECESLLLNESLEV